MTGDGLRDHDPPAVYVVTVEHNLVVAIGRVDDAAVASIPQTKLEVATQLAENFRANGCIDGRYHFANAQRARVFAALCLEFTQAQVARRLAAIRSHAVGADFNAGDA
jgi:hypothetical protein